MASQALETLEWNDQFYRKLNERSLVFDIYIISFIRYANTIIQLVYNPDKAFSLHKNMVLFIHAAKIDEN